MNKELILEIFDDHSAMAKYGNDDTLPCIEECEFYSVAEEISQMFCNKLYDLMYMKYRSRYSPKDFCKIITDNVEAESAASGFTVEEIKHSLEIISCTL